MNKTIPTVHLHRNHSPEPSRVYKETRTSIERDQKNEQLAKQFRPSVAVRVVLGVLEHSHNLWILKSNHSPEPGVIEIRDKWPQWRCTATNIFLVATMI